MIRKSGNRFSLATNAERVCAEIMLKTEGDSIDGSRLSNSWRHHSVMVPAAGHGVTWISGPDAPGATRDDLLRRNSSGVMQPYQTEHLTIATLLV
jgi:hypothetical protein